MKSKNNAGVPTIQGPIISECFLEEQEETLIYTISSKIKIKFIDMLVKNLYDQVYAFNLEVNGSLMAIFHDRRNN
ncbi:hypothetical protein [Ornithinibacillus halotolerans]|uniref:hypothetical protein n=1 Tax=Ornithinibacillus halotolerans TaxID=1274357 RepID=UPI001E5D55CF|nr:hypothetical protein [Ornithinibacillus halotolerans]